MSQQITEDFNYSASISSKDIRENFATIDPECFSEPDVHEILLYLFNQKPGFIDRGHELNNRDTAWVNAHLFRLKSATLENGTDGFIVETMGSSMDKMAELRSLELR